MSKNLRERAELTAQELNSILGISEENQSKEVADAIENAIIKALIDERKRCADVAAQCCADDAKKAKEISEEVNRVRSVLITNLSAMR